MTPLGIQWSFFLQTASDFPAADRPVGIVRFCAGNQPIILSTRGALRLPGQQHVAPATRDNAVDHGLLPDGGRIFQVGHGDRVTAVAFSPDGRQIVRGSLDNTLKVWDASGGQELRTHSLLTAVEQAGFFRGQCAPVDAQVVEDPDVRAAQQ